MGLKRLPNNASLDELLNTIEESEEKDVIGVSDDVFSFLSHFNILPGENLVLKSVVYDLYRTWSKEPLDRTRFSLRLGKHFIRQTTNGRLYFKINVDSLSIQKETLLVLEKTKTNRIKYPTWQKHFNDFLNHYKISKGKTWVQSFVLMHFYDKWCYKNKRKIKFSEITFFNFCKLYFKYKRNAESRMMWFGINEQFVKDNLSAQKLLHLQQGRELQYGKRKKSKNKIPSVKTRVKSKNKV